MADLNLANTLTPRKGFGDKSETVESLEALQSGALTPEWLEANYPTRNLQTVVETIFARLEGHSGTVGFHLQQSMGGGKTHTLLCLGLLGRDPRLLKRYFPDIHIADETPVKVVCIDGRANHRNGIWGTVAEQLGKPSELGHLYSPLTAPDPADWKKLLDGERVLILLDELPFYLDKSIAVSVGNSNLCKVTATALTTLMVACSGGPETKRTGLVMADLNAEAYPDGSSTIQQITTQVLATLGGEAERILEDLQPIELETNDLYKILRKRLFQEDPAPDTVNSVAGAYREALRKAADNHYCSGDPTRLAADMEETYPFSPAIKHLAARFRNNAGFQQTRGMIRLFSRVIAHLYESGQASEILLIGPEHVDVGQKPIRDQIKRVNEAMQNALARDFYQDGGTANLQQVEDGGEVSPDDLNAAARILLFASLSHKESELGLTPAQLGTWFASPGRDITKLPKIWERLQETCDYLHRTDPDNKLLFRPIENILVWVRRRAADLAEPTVRKRIASKLEELFKPDTGDAYQKVEAFPSVADLSLDKEKTTLVILSPQNREGLPEEAKHFWDNQRYKNRLLFLTGLKNGFANLSEHTRKLIATEEALDRKDVGATERRMLEEQKERAMAAFREAIIQCFDTIFYPVDGENLDRASFRLEYKDDGYRGSHQVTSELEKVGKFQAWDESNIASHRDYAQEELFDSKVMRWSDVKENAAIRPTWILTPPGWLDQLKLACTGSDWWRDVGSDQVERGPFERKTALAVIPLGQRDGVARLSLKPTPQGSIVKWCPGETFDESQAATVEDLAAFETNELKVVFRCIDPDGQWETGPDQRWQGKPELKRGANPRPLEFQATHGGEIWYTTDGSKPEPGKANKYVDPITPPEDCTVVQAVAEAQGVYSAPVSASVTSTGPRKGKVRYCGSLAPKGAAEVNAALGNLASAKARIEIANVRLSLEGGAAVELQVQDASFTPEALRRQIEAVVGALGDLKDQGEERLLELMQLFFPNAQAFEDWVKQQGVRYKESEVDYVE